MAEEKVRTIECSECESVPQLYETPYGDSDYIVSCECDGRGIDVSDEINGNVLLDALSGQWSNLDYAHERQ